MPAPCTRRAWLAAALAAPGCAALPADQAAGTPAESVARLSAATVLANDVTVGAAVCLAPGLALTNAHVVRAAALPLRLRGAGGEAEVTAIRPIPGRDLAVLSFPPALLHPAAVERRAPRPGEVLWAVGPEGLGRGLARGPVLRPELRLAGYGPGFTARFGALMGFSGGPVVNAEGRVAGLTTALLNPGRAGAWAGLSGMDLDGLANPAREVFALSVAPQVLPATVARELALG